MGDQALALDAVHQVGLEVGDPRMARRGAGAVHRKNLVTALGEAQGQFVADAFAGSGDQNGCGHVE